MIVVPRKVSTLSLVHIQLLAICQNCCFTVPTVYRASRVAAAPGKQMLRSCSPQQPAPTPSNPTGTCLSKFLVSSLPCALSSLMGPSKVIAF